MKQNPDRRSSSKHIQMETQQTDQVRMSDSRSNRQLCIIFSFILLSLTLLSLAILLILFILKPRKPVFDLHSIRLDAFKLNVSTSTKQVSVSCSMATLIFVTQNPNKLGIKYVPSELGILYQTVPVGTVEVPTFYQPAHSTNVSVVMYVSIDQLDLSRIINGSHVEVQILGGIGVQAHLLNFPLPRIKVSLDCRIALDYSIATLSKGLQFIERHKAVIVHNVPHLSQKCSFALL